MEGEKPPYPTPPPADSGCCRKCWFYVFPYFQFKSLTFVLWALFTVYTAVVSALVLSEERYSDVCVYYRWGASYAPAVQQFGHLHRWLLPFFMHVSLFQSPLHWLFNSYAFFLAGCEAEYFLGWRHCAWLAALLQLGSVLFSENIAGAEKVAFGASGVIVGLFAFHAMRLFLGLERANTPYGCRLLIFPVFAFLSVLFVSGSADRWGHFGGLLLGLLLAPTLFYIPWRRRMERKAKL